jgi:hypothetical protein
MVSRVKNSWTNFKWWSKRSWCRIFLPDRMIKLNFDVTHELGEIYRTPMGHHVMNVGMNWYYILGEEENDEL